MSRFFSLDHLKYEVISPLQEAWQARQVLKRFPQMAPIIEAYKQLYPHPGASTSVSVNERESKGLDDDTLTYGETRWSTFLDVLKVVEMHPGEHFIDLGCGAGFLCFLVAQGLGLKATGVDLIEGFIQPAQQLCQQLQLQQPRFIQADFFELSFLPFQVFYATCTCFPDEIMEKLSDKLAETAPGTRFITVTSPVEGPHIRQLRRLSLRYPWGHDTVYIACRK